MWTSSRSIPWARNNGKYTLRYVVLFFIAVVVISYLDIKILPVSFSPVLWAKPRNRILCWVPSAAPSSNESNAIHVKRTWGARCDKLIFISTETSKSSHTFYTIRFKYAFMESLDEELGAIGLPNLEEGHEWLWGKTKAALKFIWDEHAYDYDWFLKADEDTYVIMENLRHFLEDFDANEPYYFGCRLKYEDIEASVNFGGAGYVLSRDALRVFVVQALPDAGKCKQDDDGDEDTELGKCLANVGITPTDTRDKEGKHRFLHSHPDYHFGTLMDMEKWIDVLDHEAPGLNCCSPGIISFHQLDRETLYTLEFLIYHFHLYDSHEPR